MEARVELALPLGAVLGVNFALRRSLLLRRSILLLRARFFRRARSLGRTGVGAAALLLTACAIGPRAGRTNFADLSTLGLADVGPGPVEVRVFRPSCPWCLEDLRELARERPGDYPLVCLIGFRREGRDSAATFTRFVQNDLPGFGLPPGGVRAFYVDEDLETLRARKNHAGEPLFPGLRGVPYHLVVAQPR